jgi:hypothetical protein
MCVGANVKARQISHTLAIAGSTMQGDNQW